MSEVFRDATPWPKFIGCVVVVSVLYFAQAVIVPVSMALLMVVFVRWLRRWQEIPEATVDARIEAAVLR